MSHILLIGAGFSKNWNGLLAKDFFGHLLSSNLLDDYCRNLLRVNCNQSFEKTLSILQRAGGDSLARMEDAIVSVFNRMNKTFLEPNFTIEFLGGASVKAGCTVKQFLTKFDAIFSLNQDLLLENAYCNQAQPPQAFGPKWNDYSFPGIKPLSQLSKASSMPKWCGLHCPNLSDFSNLPDAQPIYKLHGSVNWVDESTSRLLIMGEDKYDAINGSALLRYYNREFHRRLNLPGAKLMIIGYGFQDPHINEEIEQAASGGELQLFIIDPWGYEAPDPQRGNTRAMRLASPVNSTQSRILGFSQCGLNEIFGSNSIERSNVLSFFE